jgi:hypothetical protein
MKLQWIVSLACALVVATPLVPMAQGAPIYDSIGAGRNLPIDFEGIISCDETGVSPPDFQEEADWMEYGVPFRYDPYGGVTIHVYTPAYQNGAVKGRTDTVVAVCTVLKAVEELIEDTLPLIGEFSEAARGHIEGCMVYLPNDLPLAEACILDGLP